MLRAVIPYQTLRAVVQTVHPLVDEARVDVSPTGIKIRAVDPASVAAVGVDVPSSACKSFAGSDGSFGLDFDRLSDYVSALGGGEVGVDVEGSRLLLESGRIEYRLNTLDPSAIRKPPKIPELTFAAEVELSGAEFRRAIRGAKLVGDHVVMGVEDDRFMVESEGEVQRFKLEMLAGELLGMRAGRARSMFSLEYLSTIAKALAGAQRVKLELSTDYPLRVSAEIAGIAVRYLIAPRIEEE
ncbi:MAG: DNA polymerase sliding clamp [Methanoculleus sp.]